MCWLDKKSTEVILKIRDKFDIQTFVETGTFKGVNAKLYAQYFNEVLTCDINDEYLDIARKRLKPYDNVNIFKRSSPDFLKRFINKYKTAKREDTVLFFLDAHFYDPLLEEKWVVKQELKILKNFKNCVIIIHDFDCEGWGHCVYEGEPLGFPVIGKYLKNKHLYTNTICDIYNEETIKDVEGIDLDEDTLDNVKYAWTKKVPERGILYCLPKPLKINGLKPVK